MAKIDVPSPTLDPKRPAMLITVLLSAAFAVCLIVQAAAENFCGVNYGQAALCENSCPGGVDSECPSGQTCFGSVTCETPSTTGSSESYCGTDYDEAINCDKSCPSGSDSECSPGQRCFGSVVCGGVANKPVKAECGLGSTCPLKACCSVFGYCGWTRDFCNDKCQSDCEYDVSPGKCDKSAPPVRFGYYAGWSTTRSCRKVYPSNLQAATSKYSHLAFSFAHVSQDFRIIPASSSDVKLYQEFTALKNYNPAVKTVIAVGGWAFNDPPTQHRFSNMVATPQSRKTFIDSCIKFMRLYRFDGIDLDWEYPGAPDRGGSDADYANYVSLLSEMRSSFSKVAEHFTITMAVPLSNWYLRHFDIAALAKHVDFFNVMSYDLHGVWDGSIPSLGPFVRAHTNMTEIRENMRMFYKNDVPSSKIVLGLGGYGRTWTLADMKCTKPGCRFTGPGVAGPCTGAAGFKGYFEIRDQLAEEGLSTSRFDEDSGSMYLVQGNQWISYDSTDTFRIKKKYADDNCLRGTMVWSVDMIDGTDVHGPGNINNGGSGSSGNGENNGQGTTPVDSGDDDENDDDNNGNKDDDNGDDGNDDNDGGDDEEEPPRACDCRDPYPDKSGALCYPRCEDGWRGAGPLCHKDCPSDYKDIGLFCQKPESYGRGAGYAWQLGDPAFENDGQMRRCEEDHGEDNCEQNGLLVYPKCKSGFWPIGCCVCTPECPDGMRDTGTGCTKPTAKGRGAGKVLPCVKDFFEKDLECIADAMTETVGLFDLNEAFSSIRQEEESFQKGACNMLQMSLALSPMLFLRRLLSNCVSAAGFSVYGGFGVEGGFGVAAGGGFGVGVGDGDSRACFVSGCGGLGINAGVSGNVFVGVLVSGNTKDLGGAAIAIDQDVKGGAGFGWTYFISIPSGITSVELALGAGAQVNVGSIKGCYADVTPYMEE